jgi:hypothetical protein
MLVAPDILCILRPLADCAGWEIAEMSGRQFLKLLVFDRPGANYQ